MVEIGAGHFTALVIEEERSAEEEIEELLGTEASVWTEMAGGDAVVEIDQDFAEIEHNESDGQVLSGHKTARGEVRD
jgi:hypothetical protein